MKLREVVLKNFRDYYRETRIPVDDLTALIGKDDVGKSTIWEAHNILFNQIKIDIGDRNVFHADEETIIGCIFDNLPTTIVLENVTTSLEREYLLNDNGTMEILKKYPANGKQTIWIRAKHPSNEGFDDLLLKKNNDLKTKIRSDGLGKQVNLTINSEMRCALWASLGDSITFETKLINTDQADEKSSGLKSNPFYLPIVFQSR